MAQAERLLYHSTWARDATAAVYPEGAHKILALPVPPNVTVDYDDAVIKSIIAARGTAPLPLTVVGAD